MTACDAAVALTTVAGKTMLDGDTLNTGGGGATPVPDSPTIRSTMLLLMTMEAARAPSTVGRNDTDNVQIESGGTGALQVLVDEKSPGCVPTRAIDEIRSVPLPVFLSVRVCGAPVEPTTTLENPALGGVRVIAG